MSQPDHLNLADWCLDARVREGRGDRVAIVHDRAGQPPETWTYRDVQRLADRFARALVALGVLPEQRVIIALPDGPLFAGALFGILKAGAVVVMVNPDLPATELGALACWSRAQVVVCDAATAPSFAGQRLLLADQLEPGDEPFTTFASHADDPAIWLFSGGTTGRPKAVVQPHASFVNTTRLYAHGTLGYGEGDVTLSVPKLYFGYATGSNLLFPFSVGGTTILFPEKPTPARIFELCRAHRPTLLINVPTFVGRMLGEPGDLDSVRAVTSAGEALPEALHQRFRERFGKELLDGLGTAEMWHIFLTNRPGEIRPGTLGRAVDGFEVRACDDDGRPVPDGEVGWLWVRGASRGLGYFQDHARSCAVFRGEWYASADMVRRDADGFFTYCGRGDDMLKVAGKWLSPAEVEDCLTAHAQVAECAVVGVADAAGLVKPVAFVRSDTPSEALAEELKAWVRSRLAAYKAPREVVFLDAFPRTHLGKVDRGKLKKDPR